MIENKKISLVYITKNECDNLQKSIESCREIADEIIIVDTGSTDNTKLMLQEYPVTLKTFEWVNDFSAARNYAISLCSGDYILFLDTDEKFENKLTKEDKQYFLQAFEDESIEVLSFMEKDIDKDTQIEHHISFSPRCFRNKESIKYVNAIHEHLIDTNGKDLLVRQVYDYILIHTGYSNNIIKSKVKRNIEILETLDNLSTMEYFYLCREYLSLQDYEKSWEYCQKFFMQEDYKKVIKNTDIAYNIFFYKNFLMTKKQEYNILDNIHFLEEQKEILNIFPQYYFELGKLYFDINITHAEELLKESLLKQKYFLENGYIYLNTFEGFKSELYVLLSKIEFLKGNKQNAINKAAVACVYSPNNIENGVLLCNLLNHKRNQETIEKNINFLYQLFTPSTKKDFMFISQVLGATGLTEEFVYNTITVLKNFKLEEEDFFDEAYYAELFATNDASSILNKLKNNNTLNSKLIKICAIIYNSVTNANNQLINNYSLLSEMGEEYIQVYNILVNLEKYPVTKLNDNTLELLFQVLIKMIYLGFSDFDEEFLKLLYQYYGYTKPFYNLIGVWLVNSEGNQISNYIDFLEKLDFDSIENKNRYCSDYFYYLFLNNNHNKIIEKSKNFPKEYLPLNFIRLAKPSKNYIKIQRELCSSR